MRSILWGAAAIAAFGFQSAHAASVTGHIDGSAGYTNLNSGYDDFTAYALGGAIQTDMGGWTLGMDGQTILQDWSNGDGDYSHGYAAVHADTSMGSWDVGAFVGILNYYGDGGKMVGLETRTSWGDFSAQASTAYAAFNYNPDFDGYDVRVDGSYFFAPNFAVNGGVGETWFDGAYGSDATVTDISVGASYQFANGMELTGTYINSDFNFNNTSNDPTGQTLRIGFSYQFNGGSLQDNTNHGATWTGAQALTDSFSRWD